MTDPYINSEAVRAAAAELGSAQTDVARGVGGLTFLGWAQTPGKWGVQPGPDSFRASYVEALQGIKRDFTTMRERLDNYVEAVLLAVDEFEETEDDESSSFVLEEARLEQRQAEAEAGTTQDTVGGLTGSEGADDGGSSLSGQGSSVVPGFGSEGS